MNHKINIKIFSDVDRFYGSFGLSIRGFFLGMEGEFIDYEVDNFYD